MNISTNGEYNPVQINETINLSPDSKVLSRSIMLNLRGEKASEVWKVYQELKRLIDSKEDKIEKKAKNNPGKEKKQTRKEQKKDNPGTCPKCGGLLVEKQGISKKTLRPYHFVGCGNFKNGCNFTKPFIPEVEKNAPCEEDVIEVESIPF